MSNSQWNEDEFILATSRLAHKTEETETKDSGPIWQGQGNCTSLCLSPIFPETYTALPMQTHATHAK